MDETVLAAMAKWPGVPHVHGWLALTARGQWRLRGEPIAHAALRRFIDRNYACDRRGRWFFQNGPQRVYVTLELAPWVWRRQADGTVLAHTGARPRELRAAALLDDGRLVLLTELGAGGVDDRDLASVLQALVDGDGRPLGDDALERWLAVGGQPLLQAAPLGLAAGAVPVLRLRAAELGRRFGFVAEPADTGD
jgi:hypothetical protein